MDYQDYSLFLLSFTFGILIASLFYFPWLTGTYKLITMGIAVLLLSVIFLSVFGRLSQD